MSTPLIINRDLEEKVKQLLQGFKIVTLLGPRQSGKTTLAKKIWPHKPYVNLEDLETRAAADIDPKGFLAQFPNGAIIDEFQRLPKLASQLQVLVDQVGTPGQFLLTGSHQPRVIEAISQSLAGRTAIVKLLPLSLAELQRAGLDRPLLQQILLGGYPGPNTKEWLTQDFYEAYLLTYVERDVREMINISDLSAFSKLLKLLAARIGQLVNRDNLSIETGVSANTIRHWLSILEASFLIFPLQPYFENFGKRFIKSPKIYFTDVGLAAHLLGISDVGNLEISSHRGPLFENLVVLELMKARTNKGRSPDLYYLRDVGGREVDVVFAQGERLIPIEIKAAQTFRSDFLKNLKSFETWTEKRCHTPTIIYAGTSTLQIDGYTLLPYQKTEQVILGSYLRN